MSDTFFYERHASAVRISRGSDLSFYAHLHRQTEFYIQLSGVQQMTIDGETRLIQPGEAALVLPNRVHSYQSQGTDEHFIGIIDISAAGEYASLLLSSNCASPFLSAEQVHPDALHCCKALTDGIEPNSALARAYISVILGRLTEALPLRPAAQSAGRDTARNLLLYITEHISEPLSLDILSKNLFVNKYSISRIFSEQIGCSLHTYVNALRVELAQNLLRDPEINTAELIARCGFESERTFYRTFREHCGMTPGQYRQQLSLKKEK